MAANTDFQKVAYDMRIAAGNFALMATSATIFGTSLSAFREFQKQMVLTNAIAGGTVKQLGEMSAAARNFALHTTTSATDAGAALQQLAQAGFTARQSMSAMAGVLLLAQATLSDVRVTSDVLASNIRAFGLAASGTIKVSNLFTAAITGSLATMDKLAFSLRQVGPVAKIANLSIQETTALLGQLFNVGLRGEQAGTALRNVIVRLIRPLGAAGTLLEKAGIATRKTDGSMRDLASIMKDIGKSSLTTANLARIFETEALAGALAIIKSVTVNVKDGKTAYDLFLASITGTNKALELSAKNLNTLDGSLILMKNSTHDLLITLGEKFAPAVRNFAQYTIDLADAFRGLTKEQQDGLTSGLKWTAYIISSAAAISTLGFVLKGAGRAVKSFYKVLITAFIFLSKVPAVAIEGITAAAARLTLILPALDAALLSTYGAMESFGIATLALGPGAPILVGLGLITAALGLGYAAWKLYGDAAARAAKVKFNAPEVRRIRESTKKIVDGIMGDGVLAEIAGRNKAIQGEIAIAKSTYADFPRFIAGQNALPEANANASRADPLLAQLAIKFKNTKKVLALLASIRNIKGLPKAAKEGVVAKAIESLPLATREEFKAYELQRAKIQKSDANTQKTVDVLIKMRSDSLDRFLLKISAGTLHLDKKYAMIEPAIKAILSKSGAITAIVAALKDNKHATMTDVLAQAMRQGGFNLSQIAKILGTTQAKGINALNVALNKNIKTSDKAYNVSAKIITEAAIANAKTVVEATAIARRLGIFELKQGLEKEGKKSRNNYSKYLAQFGFGVREGMKEAIATAAANLKEQGITMGDNSFTDLVSGKALVEALRRSINKDTSDVQLSAILKAKTAKFKAIMQAEILAMQGAGLIGTTDAQAIRLSWEHSVQAIWAAALAGVAKVKTSVAKAAKDTKSRITSGESAVKKAERLAKSRLRDARAIEDAFKLAARAGEASQKALASATHGTSIQSRTSLTIKFNVTDITNKFNDEITKMKRKLQDVSIGFKGSPKQLEKLKEDYQGVIVQIEAAKNAEIANATSFTAQMAARSKAFDKFKRDMTDFAGATKDTFTKIAAGISIAFSEYNKQLVTLTQISTDAITSMLDTITKGIGDFIFDNKNAWESFKSSMLTISRQIFEGFTKSLIQQAISSGTGGKGSIFGNALQPSKYGDSGVPSVGGGGGIIGKILRKIGLGGIFGEKSSGKGKGIAGILGAGNSTASMKAAFEKASRQMSQIFTRFTTSITATLNRFGTRFAAALSSAIRAVQSAAGGGGGIGSILGGSKGTGVNFSSIGSGGDSGSGSGIWSKLLNWGLSLLGFAEGGHVKGPGNGTSDSILAYLSNGEFVVKADMVKQFKPLLEAMNSGRLSAGFSKAKSANMATAPRFADGGLVGSNVVSLTPKLQQKALGIASSTTSVTKHGDTITVNVTYNMQGGASSDGFQRSSAQHAKQIAAAIQDARRNT